MSSYGLPPTLKGNFVDHVFVKADYLANILQHASLLAMAASPSNSLLPLVNGVKVVICSN